MYSYITSFCFCWVFCFLVYNIAGLYWLFGHFTRPRFIRTFFFRWLKLEWRREKRIGAVYDYLDLFLRKRLRAFFVSRDSILFFNDGIVGVELAKR